MKRRITILTASDDIYKDVDAQEILEIGKLKFFIHKNYCDNFYTITDNETGLSVYRSPFKQVKRTKEKFLEICDAYFVERVKKIHKNLPNSKKNINN